MAREGRGAACPRGQAGVEAGMMAVAGGGYDRGSGERCAGIACSHGKLRGASSHFDGHIKG